MTTESESLKVLIKQCKPALYIASFFSLIISLLMLTFPIYMIQLFDKVVQNHNTAALGLLTVLALLALITLNIIDYARYHLVRNTSYWFIQNLNRLVLQQVPDQSINHTKSQAIYYAHLATLKSFFISKEFITLLDLPWSFIYLGVLWLLHPIFVLIPLVLMGLTILIHIVTKHLLIEEVSNKKKEEEEKQNWFIQLRNNPKVVQIMGLLPVVSNKINHEKDKVPDASSLTPYAIHQVLKWLRMCAQITLLAVGAILILNQSLTTGMLIAAIVLSIKLFASIEHSIPLKLAIENAKKSYQALDALLKNAATKKVLPNQKFNGLIKFNEVYFSQNNQPILKQINLSLSPGEITVLVGPAGSGKTTLLNLAAGLIRPSIGAVTIDNCPAYDLDKTSLGPKIGYVGHVNCFFYGNIAQNIARFSSDATEQNIIEAAKKADVHDTILAMPERYDTLINPEINDLNSETAKKIALARAFYNNPTLLFFDEVEQDLYPDSRAHLHDQLIEQRKNGTTILLITRSPRLAKICDKVVILVDGRIKGLGPYDIIIDKLRQEDNRLKMLLT